MKNLFIYVCFSFLLLYVSGCSSSKESYNRKGNNTSEAGSLIRVLLDEQQNNYQFINESTVYLKNRDSYLALVNPGNTLSIANTGDKVEVEISGKNFRGKDLQLVSESTEVPVTYKGKSYRGTISIIPDGNEIRIINLLSLEDYLKGVIPKEMPTGKGNEYYEALKAFTICARTYSVIKQKESRKQFDVFADTRDQVYGGSGYEKEIINEVVDETRGMILTYDGKPAVTFYHSTCGGYTEDAKNVFPKMNLPYLVSIKDGAEPFCSISPKFTWKETFSENSFIQRLVTAGYLKNSDYSVKEVNINSTFRSGRIDELEIDLTDNLMHQRTVKLYGNNIRYVIRTTDNKSILESNNFHINKDSRGNIIINGKGYGHGVGLCQWGALAQSKEGRDYEDILAFYYPGTKIERYYDK